MNHARRAKLEEAFTTPLIVKFFSPYESGSTQGYVLDMGPEFFLLGLIDDRLRFNGFECWRVSDVKKLKAPAQNAEFITNALRLRRESIDKKPDINLSNISALLRSASMLFPLITIHRERIDPNTCKIGKIIDIDDVRLRLLEIGPDAVWEEKPTKIRLSDITRVDFGGGYEEALHLVGGDPDHVQTLNSQKRKKSRQNGPDPK
jgi:hypothetical protein